MERAAAARDAGGFATVLCSTTTRARIRGRQFVTRKITRAVAEIAAGGNERLTLGNLDVVA